MNDNLLVNSHGNGNELQELLSAEIQVWGAQQETLEKQALEELNIFSQRNTQVNNNHTEKLEDGEIPEATSCINNEKTPGIFLDINSYINSQEKLKKQRSLKRNIESTNPHKEIADQISEKLTNPNKRRKRNEQNVNTEISNSQANKCVEDSHDYTLNDNDNLETVAIHEDESGSEYIPSEPDSDYEPGYGDEKANSRQSTSKRVQNNLKKYNSNSTKIEKLEDDGLLACYKKRLKKYYKRLEEELAYEHQSRNEDEDNDEEKSTDIILKGGLKVPVRVWNKLYKYQQGGVKWLWKIHQEASGGLLGDEMGLGKTIQIIAFLLSLENSRISSCHGRFNGLGPSLIVCPATVVRQWVQHFHEWAPEFRVAILHQSGNFQGDKTHLIKEMHKSKGIIVTTYFGILKYESNLLEYNWHYLILDEGHIIRNPSAKISVAVKHFRTPHRLLLTGSPMQNNLTELWSLFDFTNPGMLGNLTTFQEHFANPILQGGFANSTPMQEATALSVATTLKDLISPYLLRRSKADVQHHINLPNKSEQVLFCSLTQEQRDLYKGFLMSEHVSDVLGKGSKQWFSNNQMRCKVLIAITALRKICNHPDIYLHEGTSDAQDEEGDTGEQNFGYYKRSGKMIVVSALLKIWKKQGHRVLLFTQGRSMIAIFCKFLLEQGYKYLKMDGSTSISRRQPLIDKFNQDNTYDVFLSTTRVGGLGVNLTGADRVIIYDPDWNPATDIQARERAWRIGQDKQVTIYRLLSAGTLEEKMYQRQVWKQLLSNKVLLDPKTSRFFKSSDLHDLFSLQESNESNPETVNIFHDSRVRIEENMKKRKNKNKNDSKNDSQFSEDKIQAMKNLAAQIAKSLSQPPKKTLMQMEVEQEREQKLKEKEALKKLTPQGLLHYNKDKANEQCDTSVNTIDESEAKVGFSEALEYVDKTAQLHRVLVSGKVKEPEKIVKKADDIKKKITKEDTRDPLQKYIKKFGENTDLTSKSKDEKVKTKIDFSGTIDGEQVDGLVRTEKRKLKKEKKNKKPESSESQDDFVLGKLFQKKGVSSALRHDTVVQSDSHVSNLRIHTEARIRAEKSLEALKKSRIDNWRW